ncbi:MAG: response regulator [Candidatus Hodarchaeota archaeon]
MDPHNSHNILVIDENIEYAPLLEQILGEFFSNMSNVFWLENKSAVLDFLNTKTPPTISIILMDIENSNFDGIAVLKQFKDESSSLKNIPIIIFSRLHEFSIIRHCFSLGVNSWIQKPTDFQKFQTILEIICEFWLKHTILPSSLI